MLALAVAAVSPAPERAYCYRTLADIVCYPQPDPGRERRYTGSYAVPPWLDQPPAASCARTPRPLRDGGEPSAADCGRPGD